MNDRITVMRRDSVARQAEFWARIEELGGCVLESTWLGVRNPHRIRCSQGHESTPRPKYVLAGGGICRTCAGRDPRAAEAAFRARIATLGGVVLEPKWLGADTAHRVRCSAGHEGSPRPSDVKQGDGICKTCAGTDPLVAEAAFRARVTELGGAVIEPLWLGSARRHRIQCAAGHEVLRRPNAIQRGQGLCRTCARNDPKVAEAEFRARVANLGGVVLEPVWLGVRTPHRIRCSSGHESTPRPTALQQGTGLCRFCSGMVWDAFYVVLNEVDQNVKFGITSGDPRPRIATHARYGYRTTVRVMADLPLDTARPLETTVIAALKLAGIEPVRGREYFPASALPVILGTVDSYPFPDAAVSVRSVPPEGEKAA